MIKQQLLNGLNKRKKDLLQQLTMANNQPELFPYLIQDINIRLDEIQSLIKWLEKLDK